MHLHPMRLFCGDLLSNLARRTNIEEAGAFAHSARIGDARNVGDPALAGLGRSAEPAVRAAIEKSTLRRRATPRLEPD